MPTLSETVCQSVQSQSAQLAAVSSVTASSVTVLCSANSFYYNRIASVFCTAACFCTYARYTHRNRTVYTADHHDLSTLALYSCIMHIPLRIWVCHLFPAHTHTTACYSRSSTCISTKLATCVLFAFATNMHTGKAILEYVIVPAGIA